MWTIILICSALHRWSFFLIFPVLQFIGGYWHDLQCAIQNTFFFDHVFLQSIFGLLAEVLLVSIQNIQFYHAFLTFYLEHKCIKCIYIYIYIYILTCWSESCLELHLDRIIFTSVKWSRADGMTEWNCEPSKSFVTPRYHSLHTITWNMNNTRAHRNVLSNLVMWPEDSGFRLHCVKQKAETRGQKSLDRVMFIYLYL